MLESVVLLLCFFPSAHSARLAGATKTFGCIHSEPFYVNTSEFAVCDYTSSAPGAITHLQFTFSASAANVYLRAYIDNETIPSIDVQMEQGMFAVENPLSPDASAKRVPAPWGNSRIGRGSTLGGRYFNFRIPFGFRVRLALYTPEPNEDGVRVFTIIRGAEGAVASAGGLALPPSARLRVQTSWATRVAKYDQLMALNVSGTSGIVAMWILFVYDSNMGLTYLEGCQRAWLDGRLVQIGDGEDVSPGGDCTRKSAKPLFSFFVASSGAAFSRHFTPSPLSPPYPVVF